MKREIITLAVVVTVSYIAFVMGRASVVVPQPCPPPTALITITTTGLRVTVGDEMFVIRYGAPVQLAGGQANWSDGWARIDSAGPSIGDGLRFALNGGGAFTP